MRYDAVVVGASVAGSSAATFLARRGCKVALLDRVTDRDAYKKACTHFIQPSAVPTLRRLGITDAIESAGGIRNSCDVYTRFGWIRGSSEEYGYNIRRSKLDPLLRDLAAATSGVDLRLGASVQGLVEANGRVAGVKARVDGKDVEFLAPLVVAADGRHSRVAELARIEARISPNERVLFAAYFRHLRIASGTRSMMWMTEPDATYCFPNDDGLTCIAIMPHRSKLPSLRADLESAFYKHVAALPRGPDLAQAERVGDFFGMVEMPNHYRAASVPGIALVGDAAMASDPISGAGVGWALQTAEWLADDVGATLSAGGALDAALESYRRRHEASLRAHHALISAVSRARPFNRMERLFYSGAVRDAGIARNFHELAGRLRHPREIFTWTFLARAVWARVAKRIPRDAAPA